MPPFQGLGERGRYSQGVALGCIIHAFQAGGTDEAGRTAALQMRVRCKEGWRDIARRKWFDAPL